MGYVKNKINYVNLIQIREIKNNQHSSIFCFGKKF